MKLFKPLLFTTFFLFSSSPVLANIKVQDYTKSFLEGYNQLKDKSVDSRRNYILQFEVIKEPKVSSLFFDGHPIPQDPYIEKLLTQYATDLPKMIPLFGQKEPEIRSIVAEVEKRTQTLFHHEINAKVLLSTSVSETDAVTTGGADLKYPVIALNMREMAKYSKDELRIVLSHELFHVLQHQIERDHTVQEPIAGNLYSEGWATYASSLVYPGFSDWKYISYFTRDNHQFLKFEADRKAIIGHLLHDWNTRSLSKSDRYFSANPFASKPFEPRSGYYIGYLAAKTLAKERSPVEVALLKYSDFKKEIKPLLKKMSEVG